MNKIIPFVLVGQPGNNRLPEEVTTQRNLHKAWTMVAVGSAAVWVRSGIALDTSTSSQKWALGFIGMESFSTEPSVSSSLNASKHKISNINDPQDERKEAGAKASLLCQN